MLTIINFITKISTFFYNKLNNLYRNYFLKPIKPIKPIKIKYRGQPVRSELDEFRYLWRKQFVTVRNYPVVYPARRRPWRLCKKESELPELINTLYQKFSFEADEKKLLNGYREKWIEQQILDVLRGVEKSVSDSVD